MATQIACSVKNLQVVSLCGGYEPLILRCPDSVGQSRISFPPHPPCDHVVFGPEPESHDPRLTLYSLVTPAEVECALHELSQVCRAAGYRALARHRDLAVGSTLAAGTGGRSPL